MRKEIVAQAATIEEAKCEAARLLGVSPEEAVFEVLQEPQKKTLGLFGGAPAKVKAVYEKEEKPSEMAAAYLQSILVAMGVSDATVTAQKKENECVLSVDGENLGFIIGRRGETLDALQYLVSLVSNRCHEDYCRVTIDIGNYREKRERSLTGLAKKMAGQAARTGRRLSLEPMNPYERRIIHTAVQEVAGATSWSVGSDPNRHVVIGPSEDNRNRYRNRDRRENNGAGEDRRGGNRSERRNRDEISKPVHEIRKFVPRSNPLPAVDGATPPIRTESETESNATLYGRIDL